MSNVDSVRKLLEPVFAKYGITDAKSLLLCSVIGASADVSEALVSRLASLLPAGPKGLKFELIIPTDLLSVPLATLVSYMTDVPLGLPRQLHRLEPLPPRAVAIGYGYIPDSTAAWSTYTGTIVRQVFLFGETRPDDVDTAVLLTAEEVLTPPVVEPLTSEPPVFVHTEENDPGMRDACTIPRPDDFHTHLRQDGVPEEVLPAHSEFRRLLAMPNTTPPITDRKQLYAYKHNISRALAAIKQDIDVHFTFYLTATTDPHEVVTAFCNHEILAVKLYPTGVTTNSDDGVYKVDQIKDVLSAMQEHGVPLCIHPEDPNAFVMDREFAFHSWLDDVRKNFPRLRMVVEHISDRRTVAWVQEQGVPHVVATVTPHHLTETLDSVCGGTLDGTMFCKPLIKRPEDRAAIQRAVLSGDSRFFYGSDSAPHRMLTKERARSAPAGVFNAAPGLAVVAELFGEQTNPGAKTAFARFVSHNGANFYNLPVNFSEVTLTRHAVTVPETYGSFYQYRGGKIIQWRGPLLTKLEQQASDARNNNSRELAGQPGAA